MMSSFVEELYAFSYKGHRALPIEKDMFMDWSNAYDWKQPTALWTAGPMRSSATGMRPEGESMKLHGAWWKLERWTWSTVNKFMAVKRLANNYSPTDFPSMGSLSYASMNAREDSVSNLEKSVRKAYKDGMSRDQILSLVDAQLVYTTMED